MSRHVVLIHRYFWPDTPPYASILRDVAERLGQDGLRVTVLTCQPSYNRAVVERAPARERLGRGVTVRRWPVLDDRRSSALKLANLLWFCLRLALSLPRLGRVNVVMAASTPPVVLAATASWLARRKGADFVYHRQDIYPEVAVGLGKQEGLLSRTARWADARTDRRAGRVVVLSRDMAETIRARGVPPEATVVINNFDPWPLPDLGSAAEPHADGQLVVVFAGNIGRFQGLETLFQALVALRDDPVDFHFFGAGALSERLESLVSEQGLQRVHQHGYQHPDQVADFLASQADLGVVSLAPGVIRAAYPSKTLSYLRQGTPILALVEGDSELACTVRDERIGIQVEPGDVAGLVAAIRTLSADRSLLGGARERARSLYARSFDKDVRLAQWSQLFERLGA